MEKQEGSKSKRKRKVFQVLAYSRVEAPAAKRTRWCPKLWEKGGTNPRLVAPKGTTAQCLSSAWAVLVWETKTTTRSLSLPGEWTSGLKIADERIIIHYMSCSNPKYQLRTPTTQIFRIRWIASWARQSQRTYSHTWPSRQLKSTWNLITGTTQRWAAIAWTLK